jgi:haloalkane dehalogenase
VVLVTHDWGVPIGLKWACDHPGAASALVISDGGFFADRRWHDLANVMRTPGEGERLISSYTREGFAAMMHAVSGGMGEQAIAEYWKAFADDARRLAQLELYRSGEFDKLLPYEGRVAALEVPALIVWGAEDRFAGVRMAERFHDELAGSELVILDGAGHFVWEDEPDRTSAALVDFLARRVLTRP